MSERSVGAATLRYTALRLAIFAGCLAASCAIVLPLTAGEGLARRLVLAAAVAAVVSVPLSLLLGRRLRAELAAALDSAAGRRRALVESDAERVRAARSTGERPHGTPRSTPPAGDPRSADGNHR